MQANSNQELSSVRLSINSRQGRTGCNGGCGRPESSQTVNELLQATGELLQTVGESLQTVGGSLRTGLGKSSAVAAAVSFSFAVAVIISFRFSLNEDVLVSEIVLLISDLSGFLA